MIPTKKVEAIIAKHDLLEKELSSGNIDIFFSGIICVGFDLNIKNHIRSCIQYKSSS